MNKYILSIGANNDTKELEIEKIKYSVAKFCDSHDTGFTIQTSVGYWAGSVEDSCIVSIINDNDTIKNDIILLCEELKKGLEQDSIMLEVITGANVIFV